MIDTDFHYGSGLFWELSDSPVCIFVVRDEGTEYYPGTIDTQSGKIESESPIDTQLREGTEETVIVNKDSMEIGSPSFVGVDIVQNLVDCYNRFLSESNIVSDFDSVFKYSASLDVPDNFPRATDIHPEYETGYVLDLLYDDFIVKDFLNRMRIDISLDDFIDGNYSIVDIEYNDRAGVLDRPVLFLNYKTGDIHIFQSMKLQYSGTIADFRSYRRDVLGWDDVSPRLSSPKVQQILYTKDNVNEDVYNELVDEDFVRSIRRFERFFE